MKVMASRLVPRTLGTTIAKSRAVAARPPTMCVSRTLSQLASNPQVTSMQSIKNSPLFQRHSQRHFSSSDDSHNDFAPKRKVVSDDQDKALEMIKEHVTNNKIMLYMKGNPSMPMCGFSATVVQVLKAEGVDFASVNVLDYPSIREGVKQYSDWPTIPQLYVNGEFIGGCDIVTAMHESGELKELLNE